MSLVPLGEAVLGAGDALGLLAKGEWSAVAGGWVVRSVGPRRCARAHASSGDIDRLLAGIDRAALAMLGAAEAPRDGGAGRSPARRRTMTALREAVAALSPADSC